MVIYHNYYNINIHTNQITENYMDEYKQIINKKIIRLKIIQNTKTLFVIGLNIVRKTELIYNRLLTSSLKQL